VKLKKLLKLLVEFDEIYPNADIKLRVIDNSYANICDVEIKELSCRFDEEEFPTIFICE